MSALAGCGRWAVRPWEKVHLADRAMLFDYDAEEAASDEHVLGNREALAEFAL